MLEYMIRAPFQDAIAFPPTAIVLLVGFLIAAVYRTLCEVPFHPKELLVFFPLLATLLLSICGTVFSKGDHSERPEDLWIAGFIHLLLFLNFLASGWIMWRLKGLRIYASAMLISLSCFTLLAWFEALMSISNSWL